jgi:hypothetical protein
VEPAETTIATTGAAGTLARAATDASRCRALARSLLLWLAAPPLATPAGWVLSWLNPEHPGYPYEETSAYALRLLVTCPWQVEAPVRARAERLAMAVADALVTRGALGRDGIAYVFDTAMGVAALAAARRAGLPVALEPIARGAAFVDAGLRLGHAAHHGVWFSGDRWSTQFQPHLLKCVIALEEAAAVGVSVAGGVDRHAVAAAMVARQRVDGAFALHGEAFVDVHVHAYALEGLAFLGRCDGRYSHALRRGVEWLASVQAPDGGIPREVGPQVRTGCMADVTAQAARLFALVDAGAWRQQAERSCHYLERLRVPGAGLRYAPESADINTWSTIFAVQALLLAAGDECLDALT